MHGKGQGAVSNPEELHVLRQLNLRMSSVHPLLHCNISYKYSYDKNQEIE
jgi:hypothetical protein